ncbi:MAG: hypothetical protein J6S85_01225 [Methanobrevibacter sp.]|nr:hypothetical protein [Methanobrevibacter sp.]
MYNFNSFDEFIASTNGQTIGQGECWDYINLIWSHLDSRYYTYPPSDPSATNHGVKWGVINSEALSANQIEGLTYISDKTQLKRGDIVITTGGTYGHGGFINSDYDGEHNYDFYSQNYAGRRSVGLDSYGLSDFGGAFRFNAWVVAPVSKPNFKWVLYARKLRSTRGL